MAKARQVDGLVAEVASASKEQSQGISQVNSAVTQMDKVTQANAANAEESASASEELNAQADSLKDALADLLRMVDGHKAMVSQATHAAPVVKHAKRAALHANGNGAKNPANGHASDHPAPRALKPEPALAAAGGRKGGDIPMGGDFKDF